MTGTTSDDGAQASGLRLIGRHDLGGHGGAMHVNVQNGFAFVGHMGDDEIGTSVLDVSDPRQPRLVHQIRAPQGTHAHKVQVVGDIMLVNHERNPMDRQAQSWSAGLAVYDISKPWAPVQIGFLPSHGGKGVHRMTYFEPPYATLSGSEDGFVDQFLQIADLSDPTAPREVGRWWFPGMHAAGGETPTWPPDRLYKFHHGLIRGDRLYAGWWDAGLVILDISDVTAPTLVSHLDFGAAVSGATHTALPLPDRDLLVVTDECVSAGPRSTATVKQIRLVDISDESAPTVVSELPLPTGDFHALAGRSGPHNLHEMRPGTFRSSRTVHATYFNAGVRVYDVQDAEHPVEVAHYVPAAPAGAAVSQCNDLLVTADGLVWVSDRTPGGGLYILEPEIDLP